MKRESISNCHHLNNTYHENRNPNCDRAILNTH